VFLNDGSATLALLDRLGEALVEVHGQHEHQALVRPSRHLELLDAFGSLGILRDRLRQRYEEWRALTEELAGLRETARDKTARLERYRVEIEEIDAARLRPGEEEELRQERRRLQNAERLAEGATAAYTNLYDDPAAALARVGQAATQLRDLVKFDPALDGTVQALDAAAVQLDEAVRALRTYRDGIVFDAPRLDEIERRLEEIGRIKRKHGDSVEAVLALRDRMVVERDVLGQGEEHGVQLADRIEKLRAELVTRAADLSARREQATGRLEGLVMTELAELDLEKAVFRVQLHHEVAAGRRRRPGGLAARPPGRGPGRVPVLGQPG
jgi:DNA repair protein RecN (Recombination protein N)